MKTFLTFLEKTEEAKKGMENPTKRFLIYIKKYIYIHGLKNLTFIQILLNNSSPPQVHLELQGENFLILKHQCGELSGAEQNGL